MFIRECVLWSLGSLLRPWHPFSRYHLGTLGGLSARIEMGTVTRFRVSGRYGQTGCLNQTGRIVCRLLPGFLRAGAVSCVLTWMVQYAIFEWRLTWVCKVTRLNLIPIRGRFWSLEVSNLGLVVSRENGSIANSSVVQQENKPPCT